MNSTSDTLLNWPRLPRAAAERELAAIGGATESPPSTDGDLSGFPELFYTPTGSRASKSDRLKLHEELVDCARRNGYGDSNAKPTKDDNRRFDCEAGRILVRLMPMTWSEAGRQDVWTALSVAVLPDITYLRWPYITGAPAAQTAKGGAQNKERWICTDRTRHAWCRLWWQETLCAENPTLLDFYGEAELNQFFERTTFMRVPEFLVSLMSNIREHLQKNPRLEKTRRDFVRDVCRRVRRLLGFLDVAALERPELDALVASVVDESIVNLGAVDEVGTTSHDAIDVGAPVARIIEDEEPHVPGRSVTGGASAALFELTRSSDEGERPDTLF
ncbi:DUF6339 family protein [Corynebacterium sp. 335C]